MGVTIADVLKLPSMRNAEIMAGRGGLQKIVSSISVLECIDPELLNDSLFHNDEFNGSEIVITAFVNITDNVELQCRNIKRLAEGGEVGLILFYVGVFLKEIDPLLIALADELDFTLICMPRNRLDLRYAEVIYEVMEAILKDRSSGVSMVLEILERVSRLPQHQQTVDTVLKMLSDWIRATFILTDAGGNVLNEAAWPRSLAGLHTRLKEMPLPISTSKPAAFSYPPGSLLYRSKIHSESDQGMELFIVREGGPLADGMLQQAVEVVQFAVRLWSQEHDKVVISELVRAIMKDEPLKMRRLADLFHIDVASVHVMWIVEPDSAAEKFLPNSPDMALTLANRYCETSFADIYEGCLIIFMDGPHLLQDADILKESLLAQLPGGVTLTAFQNLRDTAAVREAFLANCDYIADARRIFPGRTSFTGNEISFVRSCRQIIALGEASCAEALFPLHALDNKKEGNELKHTLATHLLDAASSLSATADILFLHKNTIKYRLKSIADCLGYRVGAMPASFALYKAVAIDRLLSVE